MSIVKDLREALQDVVAPDLKAVVQGLAELRSEVREGNSLLRAEIRQIREDSRRESEALEKRSTERLRETELRLSERIDRVSDQIKIADLTRLTVELQEKLSKSQQSAEPQQH